MLSRRTLIVISSLLALPLLIWGAARVDGGPAPASSAPSASTADGPVAVAPAPEDADSAAAAFAAGVPGIPDDVVRFLRNGQNWRAARRMREVLGAGERDPEAVLVAARAEAGWGGWGRVRALLEGEPWLAETAGGEGTFLLARSREEAEAWGEAADAHARYLRVAPAGEPRRRVAELRRALALLRAGRTDAGVEALEAVRSDAPEVSAWAALLAAEALAPAGDTARVRRFAEAAWEETSALRAWRARVDAHVAADDPRGARALALAFRERSGTDAARGAFSLAAARAALEAGDVAAARGDLRRAMEASPGGAGREAAELLVEHVDDLTPPERWALARAREATGEGRLAAIGYRRWLATGAGDAAERREARTRLARSLFAAGDYRRAAEAFDALAEGSGPAAAEAAYQAGRARYRAGRREEAMRGWLALAERFPGTDAAANALFLVADLSHDEGETERAARLYRRTADEHPSHDRGGHAMMRLAGLRWLAGDRAGAGAVWEEYRARHPDGRRWEEATYWAGRARLAAGDTAGARALFAAVREREPLSYYAVRAAERTGEPWWPVPLEPAPAVDAAAQARVAEWMRGVDLLREAGLDDEAESAADRLVERAGEDRALRYALAEALAERGYTVRAVRMGIALRRDGEPDNLRLLRVIYPFPYRALLAAEARERGLDPFLVAALTRQESVFKARIASWAGARGLMQIMPETGRILARSAGIDGWETELLYNPEINLHLGTAYLADQMREYDGVLPYVFSAYNAGPARVERWKELPEARAGDPELFTERIPYTETRDYVRILTRNIALYRGLYGEELEGGGSGGG